MVVVSGRQRLVIGEQLDDFQQGLIQGCSIPPSTLAFVIPIEPGGVLNRSHSGSRAGPRDSPPLPVLRVERPPWRRQSPRWESESQTVVSFRQQRVPTRVGRRRR